jgi:hypothetical protein
MPQRYVDAFFEHAIAFTALLLIVSAAAVGIFMAFDRTETVSARIWAQVPSFLGDTALQADTNASASPAATEAALLQELVQTDSFLGPVITAARIGNGVPAVVRDTVRTHLLIGSDGPNVVAFSYTTDDPAGGVRFLNQLMQSFVPVLQGLELNDAMIAGRALDQQVQAARADMEKAAASLQSYVSSVQYGDQRSLQSDPTYTTLSANTRAATSHYLNLLAAMQQAQLLTSAIPPLESARFQVLDSPAVMTKQLKVTGTDLRVGGIAALGTAAVEALLIYLMIARDPRVRSGAETARSLGLRYLGSTPHFGRG